MVSNIPVAGTFSINTNEDSKDRILFTLQVAVKQIQYCSSLRSEGDGLNIDVREVRQLCESLDKALFHGLKCYDTGYWAFVKEFTHSSTIEFLKKLKNAPTEVQRGRAWLTLALNELSLESYFRSFSQNAKLIKKHYKSLALLNDEQRMQLILMLVAGLEYVPIDLDVKKISFGSGLSFFEGYSSKANNYPSTKEFAPQHKLSFHEINADTLPCDNATEVTSEFVASEKSPTDEKKLSLPLESHKTTQNKLSSNDIPVEEFEMISHVINLEVGNESRDAEDLEIVRTKVVRRVKKPKTESPTCSEGMDSESKVQSSSDSNTSLENRLSKVTMDSGLYSETPCSSDNELSEDCRSSEENKISFLVDDFHQDICVTFSTPKRSSFSQIQSRRKSSVEERGTPEGQEDPEKNVSSSGDAASRYPLVDGDDGKDSNEELEEEEEEISIYDLHKLTPTKSNSELSVDEETIDDLDDNELGSDVLTCSSRAQNIDIVQEEMARLAAEAPEPLDLRVANNILLYFLVEIYEHEEEQFHKLYSGYSKFSEGFSQRIYCLLTNKSVYLIQPGNDVQKFFKCGGLRYSSINYISVDLNYQGFKMVSLDKEIYSLYTADAELTRDILSHLELAIRKYIPKLPLPSVYTNAERQTLILSKFLASQLDCDKSKVNLHHYVLARWEDYTTANVAPSGPVYQDYLMFRHKFVRENKATPWKPAFFLLKGGVLYCMENENSKPFFFIQMWAPHCKGCRRIHLLNRPHAFEIIRSNSDSIQLAASDTMEASKWLQLFLESVSLAGHFIDTEKDIQRPACFILANKQIVVAVEDPRRCNFKFIAKANICDLVTVFIDPVMPDFIMLEFEIAEASKSCGEWLIYFESLAEKEKFMSIISQIWSETHKAILSIETLKDLYLLKRYRLLAEELKIEKLALQDFCEDDQ